MSYRTSLLTTTAIGLALALIMAIYSKEPERRKPPENAPSSDVKVNSFLLMIKNVPLIWLLLAGAVSTFANAGMMQWLPIFFMRSHDMSLAQIGLFFGPVMACGMAAGMMLGGWVGNRIAHKSSTSLVVFSGWSMIALIPFYFFVFWTGSMPAALLGTFFATAFSVLFSPCFTSAWQAICDPRACGTTAGIQGLMTNLIGAALCTFAVGWLSDVLNPKFGNESLRYALLASLSFLLLGGILFGIAARLIKKIPQHQPPHGEPLSESP